MAADIRIRAARSDEAELLRAIVAAAKATGGYDLRLVGEWAAIVDTRAG